jgi:hypothetical protein
LPGGDGIGECGKRSLACLISLACRFSSLTAISTHRSSTIWRGGRWRPLPPSHRNSRARGGNRTKADAAKVVGEILADKALKHEIRRVVFDRGGYKFHGRVKALATGAREKGLTF